MNPQDPLANLHPLRIPAEIGWWPLAPGWWILLVAALLVLAALFYLIYRRYRKNAYRRRALNQLDSLYLDFNNDNNANRFLGRLNALLKKVALLANSPSDVAPQHGEKWRNFLNQGLAEADHFQPSFDDAVYLKDCPEIDVPQVYRSAQRWIKRHKVAS